MFDEVNSWDEMPETGLRLCVEVFRPPAFSTTAAVTACSWDPNTSGTLGFCGDDGSLTLVQHEAGNTTPVASFAIYFNTLPVHLWGRHGRNNARSSPATPSVPARRISSPLSLMSFVPGHPGEVVFVQGWSPRILLTTLPSQQELQTASTSRSGTPSTQGSGRFGLLDGSRVVALTGHDAQVRCLSVSGRGELLLTGDESGALCVRVMHDRRGSGSRHAEPTRHHQREAPPQLVVGCMEVVTVAHEGAVLAVMHVEDTDARDRDEDTSRSTAFFVSGGVGGVVRLWRATVVRDEIRTGDDAIRLDLQLLADMPVGGFQVSSLTMSSWPEEAFVLVGTTEGPVFAFSLGETSDKGRSGDMNGGSVSPAFNDFAGGVKLAPVVMKFQHTARTIVSISCCRGKRLFAAADAGGIVRLYRPSDNGPREEASSSLIDGDRSAVAGRSSRRPYELLVECRLGSLPTSCEFAVQTENGDEEVLRTSTRQGTVRVWPLADLPTRPLGPAPPDNSPHLSDNPGGPLRDTADKEEDLPLSESGAARDNRHSDSSDDTETADRAGGLEGVRDSDEEPRVREETPLPGARPGTPRRVSFAPAEEVYRFEEAGSAVDAWHSREDEDASFEVPRPPPPGPIPAPEPERPRRLRQDWVGFRRGRRSEGEIAASGGQKLDVPPGKFFTPSKLQEPALLSTAAEQAALERRMEEVLDEDMVQQSPEPVHRAVTAAVNVHPHARTYEGLVPVSLDASPPRPRRKGKQVIKEHLSKVAEGRITEDDLAFEDMEPRRTQAFWGEATDPVLPRTLGEGSYGGWPVSDDLDDSSITSERVWTRGFMP